MSETDNATTEITGKLAMKSGFQTVAFDPAIILVLIQVFQQLADCFQKNKKGVADSCETCRKPGLFQRAALRLMIKRTLDDPTVTRREIKAMTNDISDSIQDYGKTLTPETLERLIQENS